MMRNRINLTKILMLPLFTGFMFFMIVPACTFDNAEEFIASQTNDTTPQCDTIGLYYSDLTHIFTGICSNCHNSVSTSKTGIEMDSYQNVVNSINTGKVLPAIKYEGEYKMPQGLSKLSDCDIAKIEAWINAGMPEKP